MLPNWTNKLLKADDLNSIRQAVADAEKRTSAEIVPMLVLRSSFIGHVPVMLFAILVAIVWILDVPHWQSYYCGQSFWLWTAVDLLVLVVVSKWLCRYLWIQRWLTPYADELGATQARAEVEFYRLGIDHTQGSTGVLLFVSLMERRAVVLADKAIVKKLNGDVWKKVLTVLIDNLKRGSLATAYCEAIRLTADLLVESFPVQADDKDELPNELIIKD